MTKISKLVLTGFKSFAKRTEIVFNDDFNVVLGPNGSGKSNVLDGICFVLGRMSSKSLRAEKIANLIYNGGKSKDASKKAEVSIFFDNSKKTFPTEEPFVKLTRTVKENGQSVYRINDERRTRQQVLDMMAIAKIDPEGYNIILQGDIMRFVEMSGEERRQVIEEIAGISVYEDKRQKALNELERVDERMREAEILLSERKTHLSELKSDRDQALKYKELNDKVNRNRATYLNIQIKRKEGERKGIETKRRKFDEEINGLNMEIQALQQQVLEHKEQIKRITAEIEEKGEKEQVSLHRTIEDMKVALTKDESRMATCASEIEKIVARRQQLTSDLSEITQKIAVLATRRQELEQQRMSKAKETESIAKSIDRFKAQNKVEDIAGIEAELESIDHREEEKQAEIQAIVGKKQDSLREKDKLEYQIQSIDDRIAKVAEVEKEHEKELDIIKEKRNEFKRAVLELNKLLNEDASLAVELRALKGRLAEAEEALARLRAKDTTIKESAAGSLAIKKILENRNKLRGIIGPISELGVVKSKFSLALEIAAGPRIQSIVVEDENAATTCIKYLKEQRLGVATFLPLNKLRQESVSDKARALAKAQGVHGLAVDLVQHESRYNKVFSYAFGSTLVTDNIDVAKRLGIGEVRMVTIDGDLVELSGAMIGGYRQRKTGGLGFKEEEVTEGLSEYEKKVADYSKRIDILGDHREENEKAITELKKKRADLEADVIKAEKSLNLETSDLDASKALKKEVQEKLKELDTELGKLQAANSGLNRDLADVKMAKQQLKERIAKLRKPELVAELNAFEQKRLELRNELMQIENEIKNSELQVNQIFLQEQQKIQQLLKQSSKEETEFEKEKKALTGSVTKQRSEIKEFELKAEKFYAKYKEMFGKRDKIRDDIQADEENVIRKEEQIRTLEVKSNNISLKNAELEGELAGLCTDFERFKDVQLFESKSEEEVKTEISKFEHMVAQMGNVNLKALEVYDTVEKQYNELLGKKKTLEQEKEDVRLMMQEIEGKKKGLFMNTFDTISNNFITIFNSLSPKGDAQLVIENPENPFEGGVRIKVKISSNKFLDIRALSGGEKTMTALAFIFAIQEHEPASFYVLDEVDAALDKKNSAMLAGLIAKYSKRAQYILISHNDNLIAEANTLYGVSMNEHGVSTLVSLKI